MALNLEGGWMRSLYPEGVNPTAPFYFKKIL